jgi:hypothetical protein
VRRRRAAPAFADRLGGSRGQSTVELALVLPAALVVLLGVVQVGVVVRSQVMLTHSAREAVRSAAVSPDLAAAQHAAEGAGGLDARRLHVAFDGRNGPGSYVHARVDYVCVTDVPLIGPLLPDVSLRAEATMRVEQ